MNTVINGVAWFSKNIIWMNIIFGCIIVFFERRNAKTTWLWLMVLTFIPGLGFILYLVFGQDFSKEKKFHGKLIDDLQKDHIAHTQLKSIRSGKYKFNDEEYYKHLDFINMNLNSSQAVLTEDNDIKLYFKGVDKFKALIEEINKAQEYVLLQYYIIKSDSLGMSVIDALCEKAREGKDVKVLYDGMGGRGLSKEAVEKMHKAGVKTAEFFPPFGKKLAIRINYRNHRKICVIDGRVGFVGGFNIGDEYVGLSKKFGDWRDTHTKIEGSAVRWLQWRFLLDWRFSNKGKDFDQQIYRTSILESEKKGTSGIQIVTSGPDSKWPSIRDSYLRMISNAKDKVYIESPYFIPDDALQEALRTASLSGIDVRIMIPDRPDHPFVYWASLSYIGALIKSGVKCYTYGRGFLHSKVVIMDDFISSVGTANMDIRSFELNFEVNAFIYDKEINRELTEKFINDIEYCKEITLEDYKNRSKIVRIKESVSRLLSPIL